MAHATIREAVDASIARQAQLGNVDESASAAPIAMLRKMADYLDADNGDTPAFRYVTPASFLSYCDALGLMPDLSRAKSGDEGETTTARLGKKFGGMQ